MDQPDIARFFTEVEYPAVLDFLKQMLTVNSGLLALSITFADKLMDLKNIGRNQRFPLLVIWTSLLIGVLTSVVGLYEVNVYRHDYINGAHPSDLLLGSLMGIPMTTIALSCSVMWLMAVEALRSRQ